MSSQVLQRDTCDGVPRELAVWRTLRREPSSTAASRRPNKLRNCGVTQDRHLLNADG